MMKKKNKGALQDRPDKRPVNELVRVRELATERAVMSMCRDNSTYEARQLVRRLTHPEYNPQEFQAIEVEAAIHRLLKGGRLLRDHYDRIGLPDAPRSSPRSHGKQTELVEDA